MTESGPPLPLQEKIGERGNQKPLLQDNLFSEVPPSTKGERTAKHPECYYEKKQKLQNRSFPLAGHCVFWHIQEYDNDISHRYYGFYFWYTGGEPPVG